MSKTKSRTTSTKHVREYRYGNFNFKTIYTYETNGRTYGSYAWALKACLKSGDEIRIHNECWIQREFDGPWSLYSTEDSISMKRKVVA